MVEERPEVKFVKPVVEEKPTQVTSLEVKPTVPTVEVKKTEGETPIVEEKKFKHNTKIIRSYFYRSND